jgi:hypothetical protein
MGSNPIIGTLENAILRGKFVMLGVNDRRERSRMETHQTTVYLSTIRQVPPRPFVFAVFCPASKE